MNIIKNNFQLPLILIIIAFVYSCNFQPSRIEDKETKEVVEEITQPVEEDFDAFFKVFATDSVFQASRIIFPISYYSIDIEDNQEEYVYNRNVFWYIDFSMDSTASNQTVDAFEPLIVKEGDSKILYIKKGINNGIRIEYHFEKNEKGKWHLIKIRDTSN